MSIYNTKNERPYFYDKTKDLENIMVNNSSNFCLLLEVLDELRFRTTRPAKILRIKTEENLMRIVKLNQSNIADLTEMRIDLEDTKAKFSLKLIAEIEESLKEFELKTVETLPWTVLPKGEWFSEDIIEHLENLSAEGKWKGKKIDKSRLRKIESHLKPIRCYVGEEEFSGYVVYCFDKNESKAILECPVYGNATYIIRGNWKNIAKGSKWMARYKYSNQVTVINHNETWFKRLKLNLQNK